MTEKVSWYKPKKVDGMNRGIRKNFSNCEERKSKAEKNSTPQAVLYVPHTYGSQLAKEIREVVNDLRPYTNISLKIVERSGRKLVDTLHKSNPWENSKCERNDCIPCQSSQKEQKEKFRSCKKRSILYETWCHTCEDRLRKKIGLERKEEERKCGNEKKIRGRKSFD